MICKLQGKQFLHHIINPAKDDVILSMFCMSTKRKFEEIMYFINPVVEITEQVS